MIKDYHTHNPVATDAIINASPGDVLNPRLTYSVGIHPWHVDGDIDLDSLDIMARQDNVVAIGETGLDGLCGTDEARQMQLLLHHIKLSEELGKPLILHVVRRYDRIMQLRKQLRPLQPWIIHGYRGKPELTRRLLALGFEFSIGEKFNPSSVALIPSSRLHYETDTSPLSIDTIISRIENN